MPSGGQFRCTGINSKPAHRIPPRQEVNTLMFAFCHFSGTVVIIITDEVVVIIVIP